ncbi:PorV/PorQ family protein [candidate division KSB1 bacterium]|nr:PorV/PorQ family protein [candidate division KSB1 bacterium]
MLRNYLFSRVLFHFVLVSLIYTGHAVSQTKVGTTAATFLGISVGPRATAMGGAFAAVGEDPTALYYNPGAIAQNNLSQLTVVHTNWLLDTQFNWVGFVLKPDGANAFGLSYTQLNYGEEEITTVINPEGTGERWSASDLAVGLTYSRSLTDRFSLGGTIKYIQQKIFNESSNAFAVDVGLLFVTGLNNMRLGMSISNFGTDMRLEGRDLIQRIDLDPDRLGNNDKIVGYLKTDSWPLPLFFRVGLAMDVVRTPFAVMTLAVDALRPSDNDEILNVGGEVALQNALFLRAGYKSLFRKESEEGLTMGAGIRFLQPGGAQWTFDYTFADFGMLDKVQMFSLGLGF